MTDLTEPQITARGFRFFDPIPTTHANAIRAYESGAEDTPCLWVSIEDPEQPDHKDAHAHLTLESAALLRDQLTYLIEHRYQLGAGS
jgi:hypothetical protein